MIEDKLTHDERVRLECIAQAIAFNSPFAARPSSEKILSDAKVFEKFVKEGASD